MGRTPEIDDLIDAYVAEALVATGTARKKRSVRSAPEPVPPLPGPVPSLPEPVASLAPVPEPVAPTGHQRGEVDALEALGVADLAIGDSTEPDLQAFGLDADTTDQDLERVASAEREARRDLRPEPLPSALVALPLGAGEPASSVLPRVRFARGSMAPRPPAELEVDLDDEITNVVPRPQT